jgi:hypothetical protein
VGEGYAYGINAAGSVVFGSGLVKVYQPGKGERSLEMQDPGGASGVSTVGITDTEQVYGTDNLSRQPVHWDCS